jgi:hypothetical protein
MFSPLHGHPQGGLKQRNIKMADSIKDVPDLPDDGHVKGETCRKHNIK